MEIKDLSVNVERLEEVRGGQFASFGQYQSLVGGNTAVANADASFSVGGGATAINNIENPQVAGQFGSQDVSSSYTHLTEINGSVIAGLFPRVLA